MSIRPSDVLFYGGAECLERFGTLSWRTALAEDTWKEVHARTGTAGVVGKDGVLRQASEDRVRIEWLDLDADGVRETPVVLLEGGRVNQFTDPADLTSVNWTTQGLSARTANQATGPDGVVSLDELVEDSSASALHRVNQVHTLTADGTYALSVWAKANTRSWIWLRLEESGAATNNCKAWFNLSTGAVGTANGNGTGSLVRAYIEDFTDVEGGLYRCTLVGSVGNSATSVICAINLATGDNVQAYTGDGSSSLYAGFAQLEDAASFASSYKSGTRNADSLYFPWPWPPMEMTVYVSFVERGTIHGVSGTNLVYLGSSTDGQDPRITLDVQGSQRYRAAHDNGSSFVFSNAPAATSVGDEVELRSVLNADGSVRLHQAIGGAAETSGSASSAATLGSAWAGERLYLNSRPGAGTGFNAFRAIKIVRGVRTMAEMRELFA